MTVVLGLACCVGGVVLALAEAFAAEAKLDYRSYSAATDALVHHFIFTECIGLGILVIGSVQLWKSRHKTGNDAKFASRPEGGPEDS